MAIIRASIRGAINSGRIRVRMVKAWLWGWGGFRVRAMRVRARVAWRRARMRGGCLIFSFGVLEALV